MDSYFATVEQQASPNLRNRPVGIVKAVGRGCVIAASIEAKKYGVKTGCTAWEAKKLCPHIVLVPSDMDKYFDVTQKLIALLVNYSPIVEVFSIDECFLDVTDSMHLFPGGYLEMVLDIKNRLREEIGDYLKCSVGISFTKLLAKLASELHKPNGFTVLSPDNYLLATIHTPVEKVCGIGCARTRYLHSRGAYTLGQARLLSDLPPEIMDLIWLRLQEPLVAIEDLQPVKSVSRTFTTFETLTSQDSIIKLFRNLIEEAAAKLREMNMMGRTLCLTLNLSSNLAGERYYVRTLKTPANDPQIIFDLLRKEYLKKPVDSVRFAGVRISNLTFNNQLSMFNRREQLLKAVDAVNGKFGSFTIYPAQLLGSELIRPEVTGFLGDKYYRFGNS